jgi:hypothetical protein
MLSLFLTWCLEVPEPEEHIPYSSCKLDIEKEGATNLICAGDFHLLCKTWKSNIVTVEVGEQCMIRIWHIILHTARTSISLRLDKNGCMWHVCQERYTLSEGCKIISAGTEYVTMHCKSWMRYSCQIQWIHWKTAMTLKKCRAFSEPWRSPRTV